jgi:hypothetical protein
MRDLNSTPPVLPKIKIIVIIKKAVVTPLPVYIL